MARGKKTSEEKKEEVRAVIYLNPEASNRDIARQVNLPESTVREVKKKIVQTDEFDEVRSLKKQEFINKAWNVVQKALKLAEMRFDKALEDEVEFDAIIDEISGNSSLTQKQKQVLINKVKAIEMTNIRDITIALGTIYDKQALASGEPTTISERKEPTPELVTELEQKIERLKQLTGG